MLETFRPTQAIALLALGIAMLPAQDLPEIHKQDGYWFPAVREVKLEEDGLPLMMEPDPGTRTGCYLSIPVERIAEKAPSSRFKMLMEAWDEPVAINEANSYEVGTRTSHLIMTLQMTKTGIPGGYGLMGSRCRPVRPRTSS